MGRRGKQPDGRARTGAERQAAYMARKRQRQVIAIDELAVTCWCEATIVHVAPAVILEGRTETCGRHHCRPAGDQSVA